MGPGRARAARVQGTAERPACGCRAGTTILLQKPRASGTVICRVCTQCMCHTVLQPSLARLCFAVAEICCAWLDPVRGCLSLPASRVLPLDLLFTVAKLAPVLSHMLQSVSRPSGNSSWRGARGRKTLFRQSAGGRRAGLDGGSPSVPCVCSHPSTGSAHGVGARYWGQGRGRRSRMMAQSHGAVFPGELLHSGAGCPHRCGVGKWRERMHPCFLPKEHPWALPGADHGAGTRLPFLSGAGTAALVCVCVCGVYKGALISVGASGPCHNAEIMSLLLSAHSTSSLRWLASSSRQNLPRLKWMCHHLPQQIQSPLMMGQTPLAQRATAVIQALLFFFSPLLSSLCSQLVCSPWTWSERALVGVGGWSPASPSSGMGHKGEGHCSTPGSPHCWEQAQREARSQRGR